MHSHHHPTLDTISVVGATLTAGLQLMDVSSIVVILVGVSTLIYNVIRIYHELRRRQ